MRNKLQDKRRHCDMIRKRTSDALQLTYTWIYIGIYMSTASSHIATGNAYWFLDLSKFISQILPVARTYIPEVLGSSLFTSPKFSMRRDVHELDYKRLSPLAQCSCSVQVPGVVLAHLADLLLRLALDAPILLSGQLTLVQGLEVQPDDRVDRDGEHQHGDGCAVPGAVMRLVIVAEQERGRDPSRVANGDEDAAGEGALAVARLVDRDPGHAGSGTRPQADGDKEGSCEAQADTVVGDQETVAQDHDEAAADTVDAALLRAVTEHGGRQVGRETHGVDGDREALYLGDAPRTHLVDDGRQKHAETVEDRVAAELGDRKRPDPPVPDTLHDVFLVQFLSRERLPDLGLPQQYHIAPVLLAEKLGRLRAVGQDKGDH
ncbi:hypothetical protein PG995_012511 [Apiospora arundinis]